MTEMGRLISMGRLFPGLSLRQTDEVHFILLPVRRHAPEIGRWRGGRSHDNLCVIEVIRASSALPAIIRDECNSSSAYCGFLHFLHYLDGQGFLLPQKVFKYS